MASYLPKRPGAYLPISCDRFGLEAGVDRQLEDAEDSRTRLGWGPFAKIYREKDTSAFKKRKVTKPHGTIDWVVLRPEFRQLLADLALGVIDGVIFYDLDRRPRIDLSNRRIQHEQHPRPPDHRRVTDSRRGQPHQCLTILSTQGNRILLL
ncbi:hypothetical protein [Streptomyces sp. NPDC059122]|uniref:hypothetical protein n=1 Tax=Streptomyces sp. NPDC059122 TaxID=3346732 RepID=UPI00368F900B